MNDSSQFFSTTDAEVDKMTARQARTNLKKALMMVRGFRDDTEEIKEFIAVYRWARRNPKRAVAILGFLSVFFAGGSLHSWIEYLGTLFY